MTRARVPIVAVGMMVVAAGAILSLGSPRLTLLNVGLRVDYPWTRAAAAGAAAGGALLVLGAARSAWGHLLGVSFLLAALARAGHLASFLIEADATGLTSRGLFGRERLDWAEMHQVQTGPGTVVVRASRREIRIETGGFRPEQRAALERTLARRVVSP